MSAQEDLDTIEDAATLRADVIKTHREDIRNLRKLEKQLIDEMQAGPTDASSPHTRMRTLKYQEG